MRGFDDLGPWLTLLSNVETLGAIPVVVATTEEFAQDWIVTVYAMDMSLGYVLDEIIWRGTHGFFTPLGLMCHPAR